ncbi:MAG: leucyl/phenylalanyl-tRNA--protein transferase, partial [Acidimicrobiales bacterium]
SEGRDDPETFLVDPEFRGIIPLDRLKISKSLAKTVRSGRFEIRINTAFQNVVQSCAAPRTGHEETWINETIFDLYQRLHQLGHAHSVECWHDNELVGGLYGVSLRGAFFGESMFSHLSNASKTALVHLVGRLSAGGFVLLDTQFITDHLLSLGAIEISRDDYHRRLQQALNTEGDFFPAAFSDVEFRKSVRPS